MGMVPEMVIFDYGQTLADEGDYDAVRGNRAVLSMAVKNPRGITAEQTVWYTPYAKKGQEAPDGVDYLTVNSWDELIEVLESLKRGGKEAW